MKIGVFDSGIGGLSMARAIEAALPAHEVVFVTDPGHFPYATKTPDEIWQGIVPIFQNLVDQGCDAIVVACNTVSSTLSDKLRATFTTPLIALDPMVKPAAELTASGVIAVCATPTTLSSKRYKNLKTEFASGLTVLEPDCSDWSTLIQNNSMNEQRIAETIQPLLAQKADVIVLACTHYHWIEAEIRELVGKTAEVIQPEQAVIRQLKQVLGLPA